MIRVLAVSPHFAPTNAPDGHRIRLLLPFFEDAGVEVEVLSVVPEASHFPIEPWIGETIPESVPVHRVEVPGTGLGRIPGLGSLATRALPALRQKGAELLTSGAFDLVYFSTTQFGVHLLGPYWRRKFGVPFLMDFQDPWVNDYYRDHPEVPPPGGKWKFALADRFNRSAEPKVLSACSGITSVSPAYPEQLAKRYRNSPEIDPALFQNALVAPFPASPVEMERLRDSEVTQSVFDRHDGNHHWVYAGRCGAFMEKSVRSLFHGIRLACEKAPAQRSRLRIHFVGTSYSGDGSDSPVRHAALECGISELVEEHPQRIPHSEALRCLLDADGLLLPGSDDPGYSASKIFPYLLARKPLLAVFHRDSPVIDLLHECGGGTAIPFTDSDTVESLAKEIAEAAFAEAGLPEAGFPECLSLPRVPLHPEAFRRHTATAQAGQLADFFRSTLQSALPAVSSAA